MSGLEIVEDGLERASNSIGESPPRPGSIRRRTGPRRGGAAGCARGWSGPCPPGATSFNGATADLAEIAASSPRWPRRTRPTAPGAWTRPSTFRPARPGSGTNPDDAPESRVGQTELFRKPSGEGGGTP